MHKSRKPSSSSRSRSRQSLCVIPNESTSRNCGPQPLNGPSITRFGRKAIRQVERLPLGTSRKMEWTQEKYVVPELRCFSVHTIDRRSDWTRTLERSGSEGNGTALVIRERAGPAAAGSHAASTAGRGTIRAPSAACRERR